MAADPLLAEYAALKAEQLHRIGVRDNLIYATLAVIAAAGSPVVLRADSWRFVGLLLIPPAVAVLGWTYLQNDRKISQIRAYIKNDLSPQLDGWFGWETVHQSHRDHRRCSRIQLGFDLLLFSGSGVGAVVAHSFLALDLWLFPVELAGFLVSTLIAVEITREAIQRHS